MRSALRRPAIASYAYALNDRSERELLAYHWHPDSKSSPIQTPHLHLSASLVVPNPGREATALPLDKLHLPTGLVSLTAIVRMLIDEFGVQPLTPRWRERLTEAERLLVPEALDR